MSEPTTEELVERVREALDVTGRWLSNHRASDGRAALATLAERLKVAEDESRKNFDWAKAERAGRKQERARADALEAERERYVEALREIAYAEDPSGDTWSEGVEWAGKIARAALTPPTAETEEKDNPRK